MRQTDAESAPVCQHQPMMNHTKVVRPLHVVLLQWTANTFGIVITMISYLYLLPIPAVVPSQPDHRPGLHRLQLPDRGGPRGSAHKAGPGLDGTGHRTDGRGA